MMQMFTSLMFICSGALLVSSFWIKSNGFHILSGAVVALWLIATAITFLVTKSTKGHRKTLQRLRKEIAEEISEQEERIKKRKS